MSTGTKTGEGSLANRLGCEPVEVKRESDVEALIRQLTPIQRRRLQKKLMEEGEKGEGQGVA